jgi:aldehyde dehydrogenase (NAD+)
VWGKTTAAERGRLLANSASWSGKGRALAEIEATDVGKPLTQARADAIALARYLRVLRRRRRQAPWARPFPISDGYTVYTLREPHGVTGHIVPWNYPMQIIGRSLGAALPWATPAF